MGEVVCASLRVDPREVRIAFEQAAADLVTTILRQSTSVVVLATSRQPLDVDGERVWPVHPLPVGVAGSGGAVDLFLRRAADAGELVDPEATPWWV